MLNRTVNDGSVTSPVWRLVVSDQFNEFFDDGTGAIEDGNDTRYVYFVNGTAGTFQPDLSGTLDSPTKQSFSTSLHSTNILVRPNSYAVIGSSGVIGQKGMRRRYVSTVGFRTPDAAMLPTASQAMPPMINYDATRAVVLDPTPGSQQVSILNNYPADPAPNLAPADFNAPGGIRDFIPAPPTTAELPPSVAVVINLPDSLTVSEPLPQSANAYPPVGQEIWPIDGGELDYEELAIHACA